MEKANILQGFEVVGKDGRKWKYDQWREMQRARVAKCVARANESSEMRMYQDAFEWMRTAYNLERVMEQTAQRVVEKLGKSV